MSVFNKKDGMDEVHKNCAVFDKWGKMTCAAPPLCLSTFMFFHPPTFVSADEFLQRQEEIWHQEVEESLSCSLLHHPSRPKHIDFLRITAAEDDITDSPPASPHPSADLRVSNFTNSRGRISHICKVACCHNPHSHVGGYIPLWYPLVTSVPA